MAEQQRDRVHKEEIEQISDSIDVIPEPPAPAPPSKPLLFIQGLLARHADDKSVTIEEFNASMDADKHLELTPLQWAVEKGDLNLTRDLLDTGLVDVHARGRMGANALFMCVFAAEEEAVDIANMKAIASRVQYEGYGDGPRKYPFNDMVALLEGAGANWSTIFDGDRDRLLKFRALAALPNYPGVLRCILRKHAEVAATVARQALQTEHDQILQQLRDEHEQQLQQLQVNHNTALLQRQAIIDDLQQQLAVRAAQQQQTTDNLQQCEAQRVQAVTALAQLKQQVDDNVQVYALQAQLTDCQALLTQRAVDLNAAVQLSQQRAAIIAQQAVDIVGSNDARTALQQQLQTITDDLHAAQQLSNERHDTIQQHVTAIEQKDTAIEQKDAAIAYAGEVILDLQQKLAAASTLADDRSELAQVTVTLSTDTVAKLERVAGAADTYKTRCQLYINIAKVVCAVIAAGIACSAVKRHLSSM
jgi:hypothetical protein